jgi:hypothetical protein
LLLTERNEVKKREQDDNNEEIVPRRRQERIVCRCETTFSPSTASYSPFLLF